VERGDRYSKKKSLEKTNRVRAVYGEKFDTKKGTKEKEKELGRQKYREGTRNEEGRERWKI